MGKPRTVGAKEREVVELYTVQKLGAPEIAKRLHIGSTTVYRILGRADVPTIAANDPSWRSNERRRKVNDELQVEIERRYSDGQSASKIAQELSVHAVTVLQAIRRAGGTVRRRGGVEVNFSDDEIGEIIRRYVDDHQSQEEIATWAGCGQVLISRILRKNGIETGRRASQHPQWQGGRHKDGSGYYLVYLDRNDPFYVMANRIGYVLEHRLVMARHLGRPLREDETVHHVDADRAHNEISNLQLRQGKHGKGVAYRCLDCDSFNVGLVPLSEEREAYVASEYAAVPA